MLSYIFHQRRPDDIKFEWLSIQTAITWLFSADARPFIDMDSSSLNSLYSHRPCCYCPCHCVRPCRLTIHSTTSAIVVHIPQFMFLPVLEDLVDRRAQLCRRDWKSRCVYMVDPDVWLAD
jgi:hypothetical protein